MRIRRATTDRTSHHLTAGRNEASSDNGIEKQREKTIFQ